MSKYLNNLSVTRIQFNVFIIFIMYIILYNNIHFLLKLKKKTYQIILYHILIHYFRKIKKFIFTVFATILKFYHISYLNFHINI